MMTKEKDNASQNGEKAPKLWGWHTYLSVGITIVILVSLAAMVDLKKVWHEFAASDKTFVLIGMLAHYATYPVRGLRWRRCLTHLPIKGDGAKFGLLVFFYNFVDNLVPAKMGDVYGAHLARINCGIRRSAAMGSIVFLRMVDAWVVLLLAGLASWFLFAAKLPPPVLWALIGGAMIALAATLVMLTFFLLKRSVPGWLPEKIQKMIHAFHTGMWPRTRELLPIAGLTTVVWTLEILWIFFLTLGFGLRLRSVELVFLTMIPLLASAFPFTPSGAGVVELTLFSCLRVIGVAGPLAVSVTVVNRFIDYWLHIGLGLLAWAIRHKLGLRTWREVPVQASQDTAALKTWVRQEDFS
jgi:uncharacterized protein (TIRG00374 family)